MKPALTLPYNRRILRSCPGRGEGDCAKVTWSFLGLPIAEWALLWFVLFVLVSLYLVIARRPAG